MTKKKIAPNQLPYNGHIASRIKEGISAGLKITSILDSIQNYANAPTTLSTLYRIYGEDITEARFKRKMIIGGAINDAVASGNTKLIELAARSEGDWNPTERVEEVDPEEDKSDAVSTLAALLGKEVKPKEE